MPPYLRLGSLPRKRHIEHPQSPGFRDEGVHYEEVVTQGGFTRAYSILYHLRPPTRARRIEALPPLEIEFVDDPILRHRHLKTGQLPAQGDPVTGRVPIMGNDDVILWRCRPNESQRELFRNATADEVVFVHHGSGAVISPFGRMPFRELDYLVIPRCTTYLLEFDSAPADTDLLIIESTGLLEIPRRYLNPDGQLKLGAPYSERDLRGPTEPLAIDREEDTTILIKDGRRMTRYVMANHPFDVAGWDGLVYPFAFNAEDFEPITGTVHQPPPVHQTFEAPGFVICTFAPRMLDTHPQAVKVPYAHSNVQADEVLYYVKGRFGSRRGVEEASLTVHPAGIPHGPHPGTFAASREHSRTDELAVMLDTEKPLRLSAQAQALDDPAYPFSWMETS